MLERGCDIVRWPSAAFTAGITILLPQFSRHWLKGSATSQRTVVLERLHTDQKNMSTKLIMVHFSRIYRDIYKWLPTPPTLNSILSFTTRADPR